MNASKRRSERLACDRCHGQKLRCTRALSNSKACQRCPPVPKQHEVDSPDSQSSLSSTYEPPHGAVDHFDASLASHISPCMSGTDVFNRRITDLLYPDLQSTLDSSPITSTFVAPSGCDSATLAAPSHEADMFDDAFLENSFFSGEITQLKEHSTAIVGHSRVVDQSQQQYTHYMDDLHMEPVNSLGSVPSAPQATAGSNSTQIQLLRLLSRLQDTPLLSLREKPDGFKQAIEETAQVSNILLDIMESIIGPMLASPSTDAQCGCREEKVKDAANTNVTVFLTIATCYVQILQNIQALSTKLCEIVN
ncbi:hypothetical protein NOR_07017 [Metarhizium rileyi]|uniref:Zn(2)-C6 fungal-type domain-containing protein n=1 Tax=Metarhizium rileyi (strain RCEF 4871) TaxID=1649241 RepID=A0A166Z7U8_METRR|nr:hypothetical protein NOR_07017 [Metarhizium rileyi RCEF 4871]